jgi:hypothetical protein
VTPTPAPTALPQFGWILFADAVTRIVKEHGVADREAARQIITAARQGALYTQGRLHHAKGQPFAIAPAAWDGMDPYPALSMLCTPNPDTEVQEPFLAMPNVHAVEIHAGSFEAWLAGKERPPVPIMQPITMSFALRYSALIWRELHFAADTKMAATAKVGEEVPVEAAPANSGDRKRHGRPPDTSMAKADAAHLESMSKLVKEGMTPTAAAEKIVGKDGSGAYGSGTPQSKVHRLVRRYKEMQNGE